MNITNNIIRAYLDTLYVNKNQKLNELREFAEKEKVPVILKDTEELLLQLFRIKKPAKVLEIGTAVVIRRVVLQMHVIVRLLQLRLMMKWRNWQN